MTDQLTPHVVDPARVPDAPLAPPFTKGGIVEVFRRHYLLRLIVDKEIQARYQGSVLGLLWSYVLPFVRFSMYFFVIGLVLQLHKTVPNFAIQMFTGLVFVHYFTETFSTGTTSINRNKALVRKMSMPREVFPVGASIVSLIHIIPQLLILVPACFFVGWQPHMMAFGYGLLGAIVITVWAMALGLLFSALNVFFKDFQNVVATLTIFTHWAVPMMYPYSKIAEANIPTWLRELYLADPLAIGVILMQRCFWVPTVHGHHGKYRKVVEMPPHLWERGVLMIVAGLVFLVICQKIFSKLEGKFAERL